MVHTLHTLHTLRTLHKLLTYMHAYIHMHSIQSLGEVKEWTSVKHGKEVLNSCNSGRVADLSDRDLSQVKPSLQGTINGITGNMGLP